MHKHADEHHFVLPHKAVHAMYMQLQGIQNKGGIIVLASGGSQGCMPRNTWQCGLFFTASDALLAPTRKTAPLPDRDARESKALRDATLMALQ